MTATISPVLHYRDLEKAMIFLAEAFGFAEHAVHRSPEGDLAYVEMTFDGATIGLGGGAGNGGLFDLGPTAVYVSTDDVDAVHDRAVGAGAEIVMGLTDQDYGSREFAARDLDDNVWCFGTFSAGG
jgi:uncharacterized glyoxalase superfamily protein PhnB